MLQKCIFLVRKHSSTSRLFFHDQCILISPMSALFCFNIYLQPLSFNRCFSLDSPEASVHSLWLKLLCSFIPNKWLFQHLISIPAMPLPARSPFSGSNRGLESRSEGAELAFQKMISEFWKPRESVPSFTGKIPHKTSKSRSLRLHS